MDKKINNEPEEMDFKVSSATDCTGLLGYGDGSEEQLEELNDMYEFMKKDVNPPKENYQNKNCRV